MQPLPELIKGLKVLEPFLKRYAFKLDGYENGKGSGGQFTIATFKNSRKKFIVGYRFSIDELAYQFDNSILGHGFYLDQLGFANKKLFPDFQSDDKLIAFRHILHDFDFLVNDFFVGSCSKLIEYAKLQKQLIDEQNEKSQEESKDYFDKLKIVKARQKFKEKNYKECLEVYKSVEHKNLFSELDNKTIEFCKGYI